MYASFSNLSYTCRSKRVIQEFRFTFSAVTYMAQLDYTTDGSTLLPTTKCSTQGSTPNVHSLPLSKSLYETTCRVPSCNLTWYVCKHVVESSVQSVQLACYVCESMTNVFQLQRRNRNRETIIFAAVLTIYVLMVFHVRRELGIAKLIDRCVNSIIRWRDVIHAHPYNARIRKSARNKEHNADQSREEMFQTRWSDG